MALIFGAPVIEPHGNSAEKISLIDKEERNLPRM